MKKETEENVGGSRGMTQKGPRAVKVGEYGYMKLEGSTSEATVCQPRSYEDL